MFEKKAVLARSSLASWKWERKDESAKEGKTDSEGEKKARRRVSYLFTSLKLLLQANHRRESAAELESKESKPALDDRRDEEVRWRCMWELESKEK